jgi:hypothetical protein
MTNESYSGTIGCNMTDWMEKVSDEQYRITKINYKNVGKQDYEG